MITLYKKGVYLSADEIIAEDQYAGAVDKAQAKKGTISWSILASHNTSDNMDKLKVKFDSLTSHDINLCRHYSDGKSIRDGTISFTLRFDQLP
ncbi:aconitase [Salmonella bongori]|nr:aconitase [Salmonella bongori]